jgi:hypothetical protein
MSPQHTDYHRWVVDTIRKLMAGGEQVGVVPPAVEIL